MGTKITLYDTTLRDGAQREGLSFSLDDKLKIARRLDLLGVDYIEGGWPGSNPKDIAFFKRARSLNLKHATITAFGSTRRANVAVERDPQIRTLLDAGTSAVTIFGKSWTLHVTEVLRTSPEENLHMIADSVRYLREHGREVIYDAEHFFDGYRADPDYALQTLYAAARAGAAALVLCDTNGGTMPGDLQAIVARVAAEIKGIPLGIHCHNDSGLAVANTILAVQAGVVHVQGTINGYGERCGNADLCAVIPNLQLKLGYSCISDEQLRSLVEVSRYVSNRANLRPDPHQPYVGRSAFAHKGGMHVNGVLKCERSFQHIDPTLVGNRKRIVVSELAGRSNILYKAQEFGLDQVGDDQARALVARIKELENKGFQFEGAEASVELLMRRARPDYTPPFRLIDFHVLVRDRENGMMASEAMVKIQVGDEVMLTAAEGNGPVNALDEAVRKALLPHYPQLAAVHLKDYKVRILDGDAGTAAQTRVLIDSSDGERTWSTVGSSTNIIEASWQALADSLEYALWKSFDSDG